ncbi:MAG: hypothetical protein B6D36_09170 [Planctomycetes bacterium UTPLA1]|nr:MAG: hypothetical protein B6D36_09170 [Planctomycetes bacterium UTPLA1]
MVSRDTLGWKTGVEDRLKISCRWQMEPSPPVPTDTQKSDVVIVVERDANLVGGDLEGIPYRSCFDATEQPARPAVASIVGVVAKS